MKDLKTALVIDDDFLMRGTVVECLEQENLVVMHVGSLAEANRALETASFDLVFSSSDIVGSIHKLKGSAADSYHIIMTSFSAVEKAVAQVREDGAFDYLIKPFSSGQVGIVLARISEFAGLKTELKTLTRHPSEPAAIAVPQHDTLLPTNLEELEKQTIFRVMQETGGSRNVMAEQLGISIRTLRNKLNKYRQEDLQLPA